MQAHLIICSHLGDGDTVLAAYHLIEDAIREVERIVADFNVNNPGRQVDGSRYLATRNGDNLRWSAQGVVSWRIESFDMK